MGDRNVNIAIRKPRRAKGTPFYTQRNFYSLGVLAFGGISWYLYEQWSETKGLRDKVVNGHFKLSEETQHHIARMKLTFAEPGIERAINLAENRRLQNEQPKEQPWFSKIINSSPDL